MSQPHKSTLFAALPMAGRLFLALLLLANTPAMAQQVLVVTVIDSAAGKPLEAASVGVPGTAIGGVTDASGTVRLAPYPALGASVVVSALGYHQAAAVITASTGNTLILRVSPTDQQLDEVVVTSTRTNSRLEDLPTRVEVLGEEEMKEENGIKPGNIASLLGDIAGTQIQPTSPTTGNADLRIQGLQGRYSQILRDGMPVLGGYAGGFGILQIPPLDLKQAELIKGSSSTLFGGGAIAGLVNLVSKTPLVDKRELSATVNQSTLRESNLNVYASQRGKKLGYTFFAGGTRQRFVDVNGDGFADVPTADNLVVHPRLFYYPRIAGKDGQLVVGYTLTLDRRLSGDIQALNENADSLHAYRVANRMDRHTADLIYTQPLGRGTLTAKGVVSFFDRNVETNTVAYDARQVSHYSELSYLLPYTHHSLVFGGNYNGEALRPDPASRTQLQNAYTFTTLGAFVQEEWRPTTTTTLEAGVRLDHHNRYGTFLLPRLALLQKVGTDFTIRLNGGYGYRAVVPYVNELDERDLPRIAPLATAAERSAGLNGDLTWKHSFGEAATATLSQGFFYTRLANPAELEGAGQLAGATTPLAWVNQGRPLVSQGLESYARLQAGETEVYLGYIYTYARRLYDPLRPNVELAARHKLATVVVREFSEHFGAGVEAAYTGAQYLDADYTDAQGNLTASQRRTPGYPIAAVMLRYRQGPFIVVLNGENLFDYRQTRRETVISGLRANPAFTQLWAPVEGRVINLSITYRLISATR